MICAACSFVADIATVPDEWLAPQPARLTVPIDAPQWVLGRWSARAFNAVLPAARDQDRAAIGDPDLAVLLPARRRERVEPRLWPPRLHPVSVRGAHAGGTRETVPRILAHLREAGVASYLAVIKTFGDVPSPGIMSFPMAGTTVALDIPAPG